MTNKQYKIRYKIEAGKFTKEDNDPDEWGLTDALMLHSILYPENGSRSEVIVTCDGRNNLEELSIAEGLKCWVSLTKGLSDQCYAEGFQFWGDFLNTCFRGCINIFMKGQEERKEETHED